MESVPDIEGDQVNGGLPAAVAGTQHWDTPAKNQQSKEYLGRNSGRLALQTNTVHTRLIASVNVERQKPETKSDNSPSPLSSDDGMSTEEKSLDTYAKFALFSAKVYKVESTIIITAQNRTSDLNFLTSGTHEAQ